MPVLDKYIFKELLKTQMVVLLVLVLIFCGQSIIRLMSQATAGTFPPSLILMFLIYSLPDFMGYLFPLTLYISIIVTLGRICTDSEMVVMRAVGYSARRIMTVSLLLASFSALLVGWIGIDLTSRAAESRYYLEAQATSNPEFLPIDSGRFVTFGRYSIYVEQLESGAQQSKDIQQIFVIETEPGSGNVTRSITVANAGHLMVDENGIRWLVLNNGKRFEMPEDKTFRRAQFDSFRAPVSGNITEETRKKREIAQMTTIELLNSESIEEQIEAQWRFAPIFATIVLCMVAVPLSMVNPRQGRFARLMPAIAIYAAYYLILMSLRNLILTGVLPPYPGLYLVPVFFLIFVAVPLNMPKTYFMILGYKRRRLATNQGKQGADSSARSTERSSDRSTASGQQPSAVSRNERQGLTGSKQPTAAPQQKDDHHEI